MQCIRYRLATCLQPAQYLDGSICKQAVSKNSPGSGDCRAISSKIALHHSLLLMKKIYVVLLLLITASASFASGIVYRVSQTNWRWRNNDGSETTATWKAPQNTAIAYNTASGVIRLRIEIVNTSTTNNCGNSGNCPTRPYTISLEDSLQYSTTPSDTSSWKRIGLDESRPFVIAGAGGFVSQDEATTPQLADTSYPFTAGKVMVTDTLLNNIYLPGNSRSEYEWSIKTTAALRSNTTYYFRQKQLHFFFAGVPYTYLQPFPSLTTGSVLPVSLLSFTASPYNGKVKVEWSVATEANNGVFNVQRSTDGATWVMVSKTNGTGAAAYTVYDNTPPSAGNLYYRLQLVDNTGKVAYSDIQSLSMSAAGKVMVSLLPNPTSSGIHFKLANTSVKTIQAMLTDASGRVLHRQLFEKAAANTVYSLSLSQQLTPGIYILKLVGDGLAESSKVIVR